MEYTLIIIFAMIVSVLLVCIVLVQNSKGGGLISQFGSSTQYAGVAKTTDFVEKSTWTLWAVLVFCSVISVHFTKGSDSVDEGVSYEQTSSTTAPAESAE